VSAGGAFHARQTGAAVTEPSTTVAAAIITYNRGNVLRQSLSALLNQTRPLDEIIVIDNASSDGTPEIVAEEFPSVRLVRMQENTGAAGGFAAGIREAVERGYEWVWVFNDDDIPESHALETMLDAVGGLPDRTGIVGCARRSSDGNCHALGARWEHRHIPVERIDTSGPPLPLDIVTLSGTLVSAEAVRDSGLPRDNYFMMIEDLEYCLRVRRSGWQVYVVPQPLTTSLNMGSEGSSPPWRGYYQTRNQLAMSLQRRSAQELFWWLVRTTKFCCGALRSGDQPVERTRLRALGTWHALRGVSGRTVLPDAVSGGRGPDLHEPSHRGSHKEAHLARDARNLEPGGQDGVAAETSRERQDLSSSSFVARAVPEVWRSQQGPRLTGSGSWGTFWEETPEKHRIVRAEAQDYVERLSRVLPLHGRLQVLDFGCGTGHVAEELAPRVESVSLWDGAHSIRVRTAGRLAHLRNIQFLDLSEQTDFAACGPFDLILSHSVVQYMTREELAQWLGRWRSMLAPQGAIILSDLIGATRSTLRELFDLLWFAARRRVLVDALVEEAVSVRRYARARLDAPLLTVTPHDLAELTRGDDLSLQVLPQNLGHKSRRLAVLLRPSLS
jgi:GT2 family glycosyltransferase/2-polyprenyl-3-methyl-5-hydroxy-6-metoxy-1,4-benzoquinol methylase